MNYKLFSILAFCFTCLFSSNAYSSALPSPSLPDQPHPSDPDYPKVPKKPNTSLPPANDPDYGKSKWDKVKKNVKKIGKPSFADVVILVLSEAVDYVLDPENNTARKKKYKCDVHFGSSDGHYDMNSFINHVQSIKKQDAYGSYTYRANSKTIERLEQVKKDTLSLYEGGSMGINKNGQWINSANTNFTVDRVRPNSVSSVNLHLGVYVSCINPDYEPEFEPDRDPEPNPKPQPDPNTEPKPNPNTEPNPRPEPEKDPNAEPKPNPDKNPDKDPNTEPKPNPNTEPNPRPEPEKDPNAKPEPGKNGKDGKDGQDAKLFELPAFCSWAWKVCDWIDWTREPLDDDKTEIDISDSSIPNINTDIKLSGSCPNDIVLNASIFGKQFEFFRFEWSKFCAWLSILKPIVITMASYGAIKIVGGVNVAD